MDEQRLVITISHQLDSGGGYLGQKLAERLGIPFIDREILKIVSDRLHMAEGALAHREERLAWFWQSLTPDSRAYRSGRVPVSRQLRAIR